jgi:hypothetical protein
MLDQRVSSLRSEVATFRLRRALEQLAAPEGRSSVLSVAFALDKQTDCPRSPGLIAHAHPTQQYPLTKGESTIAAASITILNVKN